MRKFEGVLLGLLGAACGDSFTSDPFAAQAPGARDSGAQAPESTVSGESSAGVAGDAGSGGVGSAGGGHEQPGGGAGSPQIDAGGGVGSGGSAGATVAPECDPAEKLCDGQCVASDVEHGCDNPTCAPCPELANGGPYCDQGRCATKCDGGYEWQVSECVALPDPCADGLKRCDGLCVPPGPSVGCSPDSCDPCPDVSNGTVTCNGDQCDIACDVGFHLSGGQCLQDGWKVCGGELVAEAPETGCGGSSCDPCPVPEYGQAVCQSQGGPSECGFVCLGDAERYLDGCTFGNPCSTGSYLCDGSCSVCPTCELTQPCCNDSGVCGCWNGATCE